MGARGGVASATGCRLADVVTVSMVMLLASFASEGAGAGAETDAVETVATGAGLLTGTTAGAFAAVATAGVGVETAITGFARGGGAAATVTAAGCAGGCGTGCGAGARSGVLYATLAGAAGAIFSTTTVFVFAAGVEFLAITGAAGVGGVVAAAGTDRTGSFTGLVEAAADSVMVVCGAGWLGAAGFTTAPGTELATAAGCGTLAATAGALERALAGVAPELSGARTPRLAANAAAADSTSFGFSTGAGGSADFGNEVSST
jgi:hypothetical protein